MLGPFREVIPGALFSLWTDLQWRELVTLMKLCCGLFLGMSWVGLTVIVACPGNHLLFHQ